VGKDRAMMVGDSSVDIETARNAGIPSCGVTYGFQPESLQNPAPDFLAARMDEFADWLLLHRDGNSRLRG
jgi:phosphoglycolate phosphatase